MKNTIYTDKPQISDEWISRQENSMNLLCICLKVVLHISTFYSRSQNLNLSLLLSPRYLQPDQAQCFDIFVWRLASTGLPSVMKRKSWMVLIKFSNKLRNFDISPLEVLRSLLTRSSVRWSLVWVERMLARRCVVS